MYQSNVEIESILSVYREDSIQTRTMLVRRLTSELSSEKKIKEAFENWFGKDKIFSVLVIPSIDPKMWELYKERESVIKKYQEAYDYFSHCHLQVRPRHSILTLPWKVLYSFCNVFKCKRRRVRHNKSLAVNVGERDATTEEPYTVDSLDYYKHELDIIDMQLHFEQNKLGLEILFPVDNNNNNQLLQPSNNNNDNDDHNTPFDSSPHSSNHHSFFKQSGHAADEKIGTTNSSSAPTTTPTRGRRLLHQREEVVDKEALLHHQEEAELELSTILESSTPPPHRLSSSTHSHNNKNSNKLPLNNNNNSSSSKRNEGGGEGEGEGGVVIVTHKMMMKERAHEYLDEMVGRGGISGSAETGGVGLVGAFVTFDCVASAMGAAQTLLVANRKKMLTVVAPAPGDIMWGWFHQDTSEVLLRHVAAYLCLLVLFVFWSVPVTFLSAFMNLETIERVGVAKRVLDWILTYQPLMREFLAQTLPTLVLSLFLIVLPYLLKALLTLRGSLLCSDYDRSLLQWLWGFLLLNVLLVTLVAGSYFNIAAQLLDHPLELVGLLAQVLPKQALYLTNYMVIEGFVGYPVIMLGRIDDWCICKINQLFFARTPKAKLRAEEPFPFDYPVQYARELFIFTVALTYASMTPLMVPCATIYFALAYLSAKYNFVYVTVPPYKGRRVTQLVVDRIVIALLIYQLTMLGIFSLKLFPYGLSIVGLLLFTIYFQYFMKKTYERSSKFLPLRDCPPQNQTQITREEVLSTYLHPALKPTHETSFRPALVPLDHEQI
jgi:hypothetical protein